MANRLEALDITRRLLAFNTINPPGNEQESALYLGDILEQGGFSVSFHNLSQGRPSLIARMETPSTNPALCFAGHLDTVPLGTAQWNWDPFAGEVSEGKIYGRGASDMKSGVAAIVVAAPPQMLVRFGLIQGIHGFKRSSISCPQFFLREQRPNLCRISLTLRCSLRLWVSRRR